MAGNIFMSFFVVFLFIVFFVIFVLLGKDVKKNKAHLVVRNCICKSLDPRFLYVFFIGSQICAIYSFYFKTIFSLPLIAGNIS